MSIFAWTVAAIGVSAALYFIIVLWIAGKVVNEISRNTPKGRKWIKWKV